MPPEHALMHATLRVLSQEEIVRDVGVGFDVILDTVNTFEPAILARKTGKPDPILNFYEDFLQVFDPVARGRYGVYYTLVEVVTYMVASLDRALRADLGTAGLTDPAVTCRQNRRSRRIGGGANSGKLLQIRHISVDMLTIAHGKVHR
jgi:predicted helicase